MTDEKLPLIVVAGVIGFAVSLLATCYFLEVGLIGSEGMTGLAIVLGNDRSRHENFIQVAGSGLAVNACVRRGQVHDLCTGKKGQTAMRYVP